MQQIEQLNVKLEKSFAKKVDELKKAYMTPVGEADYRQLAKMHRWCLLASFVGYSTSWIYPNPLSIYFMALGNYTLWAVVYHSVGHKAFDDLDISKNKYHNKKFAKGLRRFWDWPDWIIPKHWENEHNINHHYHLGTEKDPDVLWRNTRHIRSLPVPMFVKYFLTFVVSLIWKFFYYAPNTIVESWHIDKKHPTNLITKDSWSPFTKIGRELWLRSLLPYSLYRFVFLPALFLPLGKEASLFVLINSLLAEGLANFYSFVTIATNHTGDDIPLYTEAPKSRSEFYVRQVEGSINFPTGSDIKDFFYGGTNYQIEHHVWPEATLYQCQKLRPHLQKLCREHGVDYKVQPVRKRIPQLFGIITGTKTPLIKDRGCR